MVDELMVVVVGIGSCLVEVLVAYMGNWFVLLLLGDLGDVLV